MVSIKHILVPTDFAEASDRAIEIARDLADKYEAKLTVMHVYSLQTYAYAEGLWPAGEWANDAEKALDAAAARVRATGADVDSVFVWGVPWQQILAVAEERGADLIVIGTHGRKGLPRALLGSVAEKVVRLSPVPVLTVRASD